MLRKSSHGWRLAQEIQKSTAIRSPSPRLHPIRESPGLPTRPTALSSLSAVFFCCQNLPPTSHSTTRCSFATVHPFTAACYSRVPERDPNTANIFTQVKADDPSRRYVLLTCVYGEGNCEVVVVPKPQESCEEVQVEAVVTYLESKMVSVRLFPGVVGTLESLKRHMKVVNEVEVDFGCAFDKAYEKATVYGGPYILCQRPVQVSKLSLQETVDSVVASYMYARIMDTLRRSNRHVRNLSFWVVAVARVAMLYESYFGRKKWNGK